MLVITVLLSWALLLAQAVVPSPLLGRWDAETRSSSGLGIWFELGDQGACNQTVGVMLDGTWRMDGRVDYLVRSRSIRPACRPARIRVV